MSKKNKVDEEKVETIERPKKRHCMRNCLITMAVVIVLTVAITFGGAAIAYNKLAEPILGIGMFDCMKVLSSFGSYKEKELVTKPYDAVGDLNAFYANLEEATYTDLPADFSISTAVNETLKAGESANPDGGNPPPDAPMAEPTTPPASGPLDGLKTFTTGNAYLDGVLKETKFDFTSLKDNDNVGKDLVIEDKQFAAVINDVWNNLDLQQVKDFETQFGIKLSDLVKIKQVEISGVPTVEEAMLKATSPVGPLLDGGVAGDYRKDIKISVLLCIEIKGNIKTILDAATQGQIPGIVTNIATAALPKQIFIGAGVYPYDAARRPDLLINNVKGKVMDDLLTAIDGVMKYLNMTSSGGPMPQDGAPTDTPMAGEEGSMPPEVAPDQGEPMTVDSMLGKISDMITGTVKSIEDMVGELRFVDSSMRMDPISVMMGVLKVNEPDPNTGIVEHYIDSQEFFTMVRHLFNAENQIKGADIESYINSNVGVENRISGEMYKTELRNIGSAYGIDSKVVDISTWTPTDFVNKYSELPQYINIVDSSIKLSDGNTYKLYEVPESEMAKLTTISDNALGYLMNDVIKDKLKEGIAGIPFDIAIESFELYEPTGLAGEVRAKFVAGVNTTSILNDAEGSVLYNLISSLVPDQLYLALDVPMSTNAGNAKLIVNFVGKDEAGENMTKEAFDTIYRIVKAMSPETAEQVKLENLLATIQEQIHLALEQLNNAMKDNVAPSPAMAGEPATTPKPLISIKAGGIELPTIYSIIKVLTKTDESEDNIQVALRDMYEYENGVVTEDGSALEGADGFINRELKGKLFLIDDPVAPLTKDNLLDTMMNLSTKIQGGVGNIIDARGLVEDSRTNIDDMKLNIKIQELAGIINNSGKLAEVTSGVPYKDIAVATNSKIVKGTDGDYYMTIVLRGVFDPTAFPPESAPMGIKYENLLPSELQISATVKLTGVTDKYKTVIQVNSTTDGSKSTLDSIMQGLFKGNASASDMSFAKIENMIGTKINEALSSFESSEAMLSYGTDTIVAMSVYDVIYDQLLVKSLTPEERLNLDAQDVMTIFKKVLAEPSPTDLQEVAGEDITNFIGDELCKKMLLKPETINASNVLDSIDSLKSGDIFSKLSPDNLWKYNYVTADDMNIRIREGQMLGLMRNQLENYNIVGLPAIFTGTKFIDSTIIADGVIRISMSVGVNKAYTGDDAFKQILPFMPNNMLMKAEIDMTGAKPTILLINGMENVNGEVEKSNLILKAISSTAGGTTSAGVNMDEITTNINTYLKGMTDKFETIGLTLNFNYATHDITTGNIYDVIKIVAQDKFGALSKDDIHTIMRGIYEPIEIDGKDKDRLLLNPHVARGDNGTFNASLPDRTITVSDYFIKNSTDFSGNIVDGSITVGAVKQLAIVTGIGLETAKTMYGATAFGNYTDKAIVMSIDLNTATYKSAEGLGSVLPSNLIITAIIDIDPTRVEPIEIQPIINGLSKEHMDILMNDILGSGNSMLSKVTTIVKDQVINVVIARQSDYSMLLKEDLTLGKILLSQNATYSHISPTNPKAVNGEFGTITYKIA